MFIPHRLVSACLSACLSVLSPLRFTPLSRSFLLLSLMVSNRDFDHFNSLIKLTGSPEKTSSCTRVDVEEVTLKWPDIYGVAKDSDDMLSQLGDNACTQTVESACKSVTEFLKLLSHYHDELNFPFLLWSSNKIPKISWNNHRFSQIIVKLLFCGGLCRCLE